MEESIIIDISKAFLVQFRAKIVGMVGFPR